MKKKGLLISTIVMVVVLVASLTTATYAWFGVDAVTKVSGFELQVVPSNVVAIGVASVSGGYKSTYGRGNFVNGDVNFTGEAGTIDGKWGNGNQGLGASILHQIKFGNITSAVGFTTETTDPTKADTSNTKSFENWAGIGTEGLVISANSGADASKLSAQAKAIVNSENEDAPSDLVYFHMGIAPTKQLKEGTNNLYIVVQVDGATLGIGAAVHVAYRVNGNVTDDSTSGQWKDAHVFNDTKTTYNTALDSTDATYTIIEDLQAAISADDGWVIDNNTMKGTGVVTIPLTLLTASDAIDQVELIIYVSGNDKDASDAAVSNNVTVKIGMFFGAQPYVAPVNQNPVE